MPVGFQNPTESNVLARERIPVTILTGFLGAGKTTLLNRLLAEPAFGETAVIVNEFGEAGIDSSLIARADRRMVNMTVGCLCCTASGDVRLTLKRLIEEADRGDGPSFGRVVIETTGLADPLPLIKTFLTDKQTRDRFALNGIVTLVDSACGLYAIERFQEALRQIAVADLLLVTKSDLARDPTAKRDLRELKRKLSELNAIARIRNVDEVTAEMVFSLSVSDPSARKSNIAEWFRFADGMDAEFFGSKGAGGPKQGNGHQHDVNQHADSATAFCFSANSPVEPVALGNAVTALQASFGPDLLRMKGLIEIAGRPESPQLIQLVGRAESPPHHLRGWPEGVERTRLVVIVSGPDRKAAPGILTKFLPELSKFVAEPANLLNSISSGVNMFT